MPAFLVRAMGATCNEPGGQRPKDLLYRAVPLHLACGPRSGLGRRRGGPARAAHPPPPSDVADVVPHTRLRAAHAGAAPRCAAACCGVRTCSSPRGRRGQLWCARPRLGPRRAGAERQPTCADDLTLDKCAPLGKRVLFVADEAEEKTAGGILLPSSANARQGGFLTGEVLAVGEGVETVKAGAKVLVSGYGGAEVDFQGRKAKFIMDGDILAILS